MYHYRWTYAPDIEKAGRLLPLDQNLHARDDHLERADFIIDRQVSRRPLVGSTDANLPIIERSFERLLDILQALLAEQPFVFGNRPGRTDFALSGQLTPMMQWDPTPMALAVERRRAARQLDSAHGRPRWWWSTGDDGWSDDGAAPAVQQLVREAGSTYARSCWQRGGHRRRCRRGGLRNPRDGVPPGTVQATRPSASPGCARPTSSSTPRSRSLVGMVLAGTKAAICSPIVQGSIDDRPARRDRDRRVDQRQSVDGRRLRREAQRLGGDRRR